MNYIKELWVLYSTFFRIGLLTFGGGYAMLPMLEREVVEEHKWATMEEIMDYFAISQCTPGVIAVNLGTFIGHKRKGVLGGIVATIGVVTPSVIIISLIATLLQTFYENPIVRSAFQGIGVAVCAILVQAICKIGKSGIVDIFSFFLAAAAFITAAVWGISTIIIILSAGILGVIYLTLKERRGKNDGGEAK